MSSSASSSSSSEEDGVKPFGGVVSSSPSIRRQSYTRVYCVQVRGLTMEARRAWSISLRSPPAVLLLSILFLSIATAMAEDSSEASVHIIYTEKPPTDDLESHHLSTLAAVLGSEEAAKQSLLYVYRNAATGFSARLTPEQVEKLSKQPGVLQVLPSEKMHLHSGRLGLH